MSHRSTPVRGQTGFSLVELLIAVTLLSVGALGAVSLQRAAVVSNQASFSREVAVSLARQLLEAARNTPWAALPTTDQWVNPPSSISPANPLGAGGETASDGYTRQWRIEAGPQANTRTIRVRVRWRGRSGLSGVELATVRAWD